MRRQGIVKIDEHALGYGWGFGFGHRWLPHLVQHLIVSTWNRFACWRWGHRTIGPFYEDGELVLDKHCYNCGKRWVE